MARSCIVALDVLHRRRTTGCCRLAGSCLSPFTGPDRRAAEPHRSSAPARPKGLKGLTLRNTRVTLDGIERLQQALPGLDVTR
jgi:hypothetical protein